MQAAVELSLDIILILTGVAVLAGFVDAIAGGGGLLAMPALVACGVPPVMALGTNKVQSSCGTAIACLTYARAGHVDWPSLRLPILGTAAGAAAGAIVVQRIDPTFLSAVMPILLVAAALYFLLSPAMGEVPRRSRLGAAGFALVAAAIGFYDGFFGPGTGSFFMVALIGLMGLGLTRATAHTKVLNLTSNLVALALFAAGGKLLWGAGLAMAAGNMLGGWLGAHSALRWGPRIIKPLLVTVALALTAKLLTDADNPWAQALF